MILSFSEDGKAEINFAHRYEPGEIDLDDEDARTSGAILVEGAARRSSEIAFVAGTIRGALEIACSRCAQAIEIDLDTKFEVEYVTAENYSSGSQEIGLNAKDLSLSIYDGDRIDVDEIVREQILLDLPARQLCSENCQGLCLNCGANKNLNACSCETKQVDSRWTALKELKIKN